MGPVAVCHQLVDKLLKDPVKRLEDGTVILDEFKDIGTSFGCHP
jgi:hypothetical protein